MASSRRTLRVICRITVDEYHRMIEAGIIQRFTRLIVRAVGDDLEVLSQLP